MFHVAGFYCFVELPDYQELQHVILNLCCSLNLKGTILLAAEGINCSVAGLPEAISIFLESLAKQLKLEGLIHPHVEEVSFMPFDKMKVRTKMEIVGLKLTSDCHEKNSNHVETIMVEPSSWNEVINRDDTIILDVRNRYETDFGSFSGALAAETDNFRDFPEWFSNWAPKISKEKPSLAMYCTGGVRCEKVLDYVKDVGGFKQVHQLHGGIINYLKYFQDHQALSEWKGECFVFDNRAAIDSNCQPTANLICLTCGKKLGKDDIRWLSKTGTECQNCKNSMHRDDNTASPDTLL